MNYEEFVKQKITLRDGTILSFVEEDGHLYVTDGTKKTMFDLAYNEDYAEYYIMLAKQQFSLL